MLATTLHLPLETHRLYSKANFELSLLMRQWIADRAVEVRRNARFGNCEQMLDESILARFPQLHRFTGPEVKHAHELLRFMILCKAYWPDEFERAMWETHTTGDDAQLANVDLQNELQKQQQTLQMVSNLSKNAYDTALAVIRKIGG